jgi:hypothetical protein
MRKPKRNIADKCGKEVADNRREQTSGRRTVRQLATGKTVRLIAVSPAAGRLKRGDKFEVLRACVGTTIPNRTKFRLACCDCGLVHWMLVYAPKLRKGRTLGLAVKRNTRATKARRKFLRTARTVR